MCRSDDVVVLGFDKRSWPLDSIRALYTEATLDNWVLTDDPTCLDRLVQSWRANDAVIYLAYIGDTLVGGLAASLGDLHIARCLSVDAAMVPAKYRDCGIAAKLYKEAIKLSHTAGCTHISTTRYQGAGAYLTKYRRLKRG